MWPLLLAAVNRLLFSLLSGAAIKFVVFSALLYVVTEFVSLLQGAAILPSAANLSGALVELDPATWYFLDLFAVTQGIPIMLAALVSRFILRRIPLIG